MGNKIDGFHVITLVVPCNKLECPHITLRGMWMRSVTAFARGHPSVYPSTN